MGQNTNWRHKLAADANSTLPPDSWSEFEVEIILAIWQKKQSNSDLQIIVSFTLLKNSGCDWVPNTFAPWSAALKKSNRQILEALIFEPWLVGWEVWKLPLRYAPTILSVRLNEDISSYFSLEVESTNKKALSGKYFLNVSPLDVFEYSKYF